MADPAAPAAPPTGDAPDIVARHPEFPNLEARAAQVPAGNPTLDSLRDVPITITARLGHTVMPISEILKLGPGSIVELDETVGSLVELTVRGVAFALGEVVVVDENFAIRIKSLLPPRALRTET